MKSDAESMFGKSNFSSSPKMLMIVYNEVMEDEVMEGLEENKVQGFTLLQNVFGKGATSGTHRGDDIWPGKNSALFVACTQEQASGVLDYVRKLRKTLGHEGVKAFLFSLEALT